MQNKNIHSSDIWLVSSDPSVGREFTGVRPAVVIQNEFLPTGAGLVTVMLMGSYKQKRWKHDVLVQTSEVNHLRKPTLVKVQHIQSYDSSRLIRKIGMLEDQWFLLIQEYLRSHFGL